LRDLGRGWSDGMHDLTVAVEDRFGAREARLGLLLGVPANASHSELPAHAKCRRQVAGQAPEHRHVRRRGHELVLPRADRDVATDSGRVNRVDVEDVAPARAFTRGEDWRHVRHTRAPRAADVQTAERSAHERWDAYHALERAEGLRQFRRLIRNRYVPQFEIVDLRGIVEKSDVVLVSTTQTGQRPHHLLEPAAVVELQRIDRLQKAHERCVLETCHATSNTPQAVLARAR
jgi:hypothetical protein